jgi:putative membrane protein
MASLAMILGQIGPRAGNHMNWDDGRPVGRIIFMVICAIVLIGLIVGVIVALRRTSASQSQGAAPAGAPSTTARDLLDQRLARGEIESADYEERKRLLG